MLGGDRHGHGVKPKTTSRSLRCPVLPLGVLERGSDDRGLMRVSQMVDIVSKGDDLVTGHLIVFQSGLAASSPFRACFLGPGQILITLHTVVGEVMWLERV